MARETSGRMVTRAFRALAAVLFAVSTLCGSSSLAAADQAGAPATGATPNLVVLLAGKVKHPQQFGLDDLEKLPAEQAKVAFQTGRRTEEASFTGVLLWTLLAEAGGIDDATNRAELRHVIRITGRDGYLVVISTGEIAPDFGAKPAMLAYRRNDEVLASAGFRLVVPGDKHGGRFVRDVVSIEVQ